MKKFLLEELTEAYYTARKGKRHTVDEHRFEINAQENIMDLAGGDSLSAVSPESRSGIYHSRSGDARNCGGAVSGSGGASLSI